MFSGLPCETRIAHIARPLQSWAHNRIAPKPLRPAFPFGPTGAPEGRRSAHKPLAVGVDVELGHLIEATDIDVNLLTQAVGFDFELLMEGDDFFAYDAVIEGVGFDCEPLMQNVGFEFEPRLEVDGVGQELITTDVGFVWEPLTESVGFDRKPAQGGVGMAEHATRTNSAWLKDRIDALQRLLKVQTDGIQGALKI